MSDYDFEEEEFNTQFSGSTLRRIGGQLRQRWQIAAGFLAAVSFVSFFDAYLTYVQKTIVDNGIVAHDAAALLRIVEEYALILVAESLAVFVMIYLVALLGERVRYDLRQTMFSHLQDLSLSYYSRTPLGWIMARVTSDSDRVADLVTWGLLDSTFAALNILSAALFMLSINWRLALVVLTILPVLIYVAIEFRKKILKEFRRSRKLNSKITGAYNENLTGVRVVKALGREDSNTREFGQLTGEMYRSAYHAAWLSALFLPAVQIISAVALGAIAWFGGLQSLAGQITIGGIQAFVAYITFMLWPIQDMARVFAEMQHAIASGERMFSLIDAVPEVVDRPGAIDPGSLQGEIEFDHVEFFYDEAQPVLRDFTLRVRPGETIALVGPTGGGKSTIVNLLGRFYEPRRGVIRIAGRDYTELSLKAIQSRIGVVLQTPHLFSGSVRENIRYGRLEASDDEVERAARLAGAHDFIITLPKGYEENVGEGGNLLSTGQKQLISLARAVLADPQVFIMDEATSSVDTLTEALIQKGMEHLMAGRTSFVIAHRLSTIKRADRILVIEAGAIAEQGTHAELLRQRGHYYRLYTQQFRREMSEDYELVQLTGAASAS